MYKKTLKTPNNNAKLIMTLLFVCGVFLFLFAGNGKLPYPAFAQTVSIVLIGLAIYIAASYVLKEYTVEVFFNDGDADKPDKKPDFAIYEQKGKRRVTVCWLSLSDIVVVEKVNKDNMKDVKERTKRMKRFKYNTFFCQAEFIHVVTKDDISVICTFDEGLYIELLKFL